MQSNKRLVFSLLVLLGFNSNYAHHEYSFNTSTLLTNIAFGSTGLAVTLGALKLWQRFSTPSELPEKAALSEKVKIGIIKVYGTIHDAESCVRELIATAQDASIMGVLLVINSGGGSGGASEMIFREILQLSKLKPVVALVADSCYSGAYMAALGADWIIAPRIAGVGSIGVWRQIWRYQDIKINEKDGIKANAKVEMITAGKYKALGVPYNRELTDEDRQHMKDDLKKTHAEFIKFVLDRRNLDPETQSIWAEGQEFNGFEALELGLIDQIGSFTDAITKLQELLQHRGFDREIGLSDFEFIEMEDVVKKPEEKE